jgi:polyhydroxyalkanoate synthesis regulator phasin
MKAHPHLHRSRVPGFLLQAALRIQRGLQRIAGGAKGRAKGVADDSKDMALMRLNGVLQDGVMAREEGRQFGRELLRQSGAALDVGEEKGDGASGKRAHQLYKLIAKRLMLIRWR